MVGATSARKIPRPSTCVDFNGLNYNCYIYFNFIGEVCGQIELHTVNHTLPQPDGCGHATTRRHNGQFHHPKFKNML